MNVIASRFDSLPEEEKGEDWFPVHNKAMISQVLPTLPPGAKVLEIGSWLGRSACYILEVNPNIELSCMDIWEDSNHPADLIKVEAEKKYRRFRSNLAKLGMLERINVIRDNSRNVMNYFQEGTLDAIYVDGSHEEEDVYHDVHNAYKLLKVGGHMLGDDWNWVSVSKGLMRAIWEINAEREAMLPLRTLFAAWHTCKLANNEEDPKILSYL